MDLMKKFFVLQKAIDRGVKTIRVRVQGLGPGRLVRYDYCQI